VTLVSDPMLIMLPPSAPKAGKAASIMRNMPSTFVLKFLLAELLEGRKREDARVVHEYIEAAEGFFRLRDNALRVGPLRHVALYGDGSPAFAGDLAHHALRARLIARVIHDRRRAFRAESLCNARSDSF
jgi:hypothetical protein